MTVSITWMTPLVARTSAVTTVELPFRVSFPSFSENETGSPWRALTLPFCCATPIA